jgi:hypothetical protein
MPEASTAPELIQIDRLVLDLPGLEASRVPALALEIARRLAQLGLAREQGNITLALDTDAGDVAGRIAAALRTEFSR